MAVQIGKLIVRYDLDCKRRTSQFDLYNDRLLHDVTTPDRYVYYHAVEGLVKQLKRP